MKTSITLFLVAFAACANVFSQISLSRVNNTPRAEYRYLYDLVSFDYDAMRYSGLDTIWDISDMVFLTDTLSYYYTRDSTYISFPESDYEWMCSDPPNTSDTNILRSDNAIYRMTDSSFYQNYKVCILPSDPYDCICETNIQILRFPFTYGNTWNQIQIWNDGVDDHHEISNTKTADASGSLFLMDTIYNNVLRVFTLYQYEINYGNPHDWDWKEIHTYEWYSEDSQLPVLKLTYRYIYHLYNNSESWIRDTTAWLFSHKEYIPLTMDTEETELGQINSIKVFPCPAMNYINLLTAKKVEDVFLIDLYGNRVGAFFDQVSRIMDISQVKSGVYILRGRLETGKEFSRKVIIVK